GFTVAVVGDGPSDRLSEQHQLYVDELLVLTSSEFDVQIRRFSGAWTRESIDAAIDDAYADSEVDLVLVIGIVANQLAAIRREFPKPTFLPIILDTGLLAGDVGETTSGIRNLNFLAAYADFAHDLDVLARLAPYQKLVLFLDEALSSAIPELRDAALAIGAEKGIELIEVTHDGVDHELVERVPVGTDAVIVAGLPRMPIPDFERLVDAINAARLPSYSFIGVTEVEFGLLATNNEPRDMDRQARLNALNMQAVMLGERAEDQPTGVQGREKLTINMATARKIGLSPSFDVMGDAVLLNQEVEAAGPRYGLVEIARLALQQNQDLQAEAYGVEAGLREIATARSNLLPSLDLSAAHTRRRESPSVAAGLFAQRSTDASLDLTQLIYSDAAAANLAIQKELQRTRLASLEEFQLDVVLAATTSYYSVLNARSQLAVQDNNLNITRANLELAEDRVRLGTSTPADVYRWQAEAARAQIRVMNARAALNQAWETLNRILHRPQGTRMALREASFGEAFVISREDIEHLVASPADYAVFSRFNINRALAQAPELQQLDARIAAKRRELTSYRRAYWLPDFSIGGRYSSNLDQSGVGAGPQAGNGLDDWSIGVQATLPLFSGGLKKANVSRADYELRQLEALQRSTRERVEEAVRLQLYAAQAAYVQIDLSAIAAEASRKNYELVSDAYARGTVTVIELLDAQDSSLAASASAAESLYGFLITIMSMQRAVGSYDYLLSEDEREALAGEFRGTLTGTR
ncbi:MAG: TolC family protein, partial [Gammaproteobacteria bacterium]|nr:TolC family protein [Gammaproteobacteria bacterium]